jgi:flagellar biosynthesis protein FlhA
MKALQRFFGKNSDIVLVLMVLGVLIVLFAPIPSPLLDFLILTNFSFAFLILLLTFYMARPVEFSTFPSLLLIATLFRLSLNVAATRLILSDGDAGRVISAVGSYVVGGNYVIGLVVFLMMMMPPTTVALPLKILMFILVDGWSVVLKGLMGSFH